MGWQIKFIKRQTRRQAEFLMPHVHGLKPTGQKLLVKRNSLVSEQIGLFDSGRII